jgi:hypothetical protein
LADDRQRKPSTVRDAASVIRNHLLPPFGARRLEDITEPEVDGWAPARRPTAAVERDKAQGHRDLPRRDGARMPFLWPAREPGREG